MSDLSPNALLVLAHDHETVAQNHDKYVMGHPHHFKTAAMLRRLATKVVEDEATISDLKDQIAQLEHEHMADKEALRSRIELMERMGQEFDG